MASRRPLFRPYLAASRAESAPAAAETQAAPEPAVRPLDPEQAARFRATVLPHLDAAYNLARLLARDAGAAEDIVQDAFVRALRGFDAQGRGEARAWLLAIVRNCFFDWTRAGRSRAAVLVESSQAAEDLLANAPDTGTEDPEAALLRRAEGAALRTMVEQLPDPFRETLVLREFEELSYREISAASGVPIGTVMSRLARARRILADAMGLCEEEPQA